MGVKLSCIRSSDQFASYGAGARGCNVSEDTAGALGALGAVCFEPEGAVTTERWEYVGEGQGGYSKVHTYNYVGEGRGTFDKDGSSASCMRRVCQGILLTTILGAAVYVVAPVTPLQRMEPPSDIGADIVKSAGEFLGGETRHKDSSGDSVLPGGGVVTEMPTESPTESPTDERPIVSALPAAAAATPSAEGARPKYICATDREEARLAGIIFGEWISADLNKDGRITRGEVLAHRSTYLAETLEILLDADVDGDGALTQQEFTAALVPSKEMAEKAHADISGDDVQFDSNVDSWPEDKKQWCCANTGIACTNGMGPLPPTQTNDSDSQSAQSAEGQTRPPSKNAGATAAVPDVPYDCEAEYNMWQRAWSPGKQDWCCRHHHRGCPSDTTQPPSAVPMVSPTDMGKGCDTDCEVNGMVATCKSRIVWAAKHHHQEEDDPCSLAIEEVIGSCEQCSVCSLAEAKCSEPKFFCNDDVEDGWSLAKSTWCCTHEKKGCDALKVTRSCADVGCDAAFDAKAHCQCNTACEKDDSCCDDYKQTCAKKEEVANLAHDQPKADKSGKAFDCAAGADKWESQWNVEKKDWCCAHEGVGCPKLEQKSHPKEPFNCGSGFETWTWGWSEDKKAYCCNGHGKGCKKDEAAQGSATQSPPPPPPFEE